jgi:hypothetical protein
MWGSDEWNKKLELGHAVAARSEERVRMLLAQGNFPQDVIAPLVAEAAKFESPAILVSLLPHSDGVMMGEAVLEATLYHRFDNARLLVLHGWPLDGVLHTLVTALCYFPEPEIFQQGTQFARWILQREPNLRHSTRLEEEETMDPFFSALDWALWRGVLPLVRVFIALGLTLSKRCYDRLQQHTCVDALLRLRSRLLRAVLPRTLANLTVSWLCDWPECERSLMLPSHLAKLFE